jgi:hypothetical protein
MVAGMDDLNTPFISLNRAVQDDKRMNTTGTISPAFLQLQGNGNCVRFIHLWLQNWILPFETLRIWAI